jgi:DNA (cytosine-5)-methyltransferase 1
MRQATIQNTRRSGIVRHRHSGNPLAIELCCGAGGMSLGFEAAGFDTFVAVDSNPIHVATHEWNFPNTRALCADVTSLSAEDIYSALKNEWVDRYPEALTPGEVDVVFGGPSCQGFSEIGRRNPADERNALLLGFAKLTVAIRPKYFVIENVPGLLWSVNGQMLRDALQIFKHAGYSITAEAPFILNAGGFGVPQDRRRVFLVGSRSDVPPGSIPTTGEASKVNVAEAMDDLRWLERYKALSCADSVQMSSAAMAALERGATTYTRSLRTNAERLAGSYGLGYERPWDPTIMTSCGRTTHRADVVERFRNTLPGSEEAVSRLPRLRAGGLSPTLRAGTGRDHGSFTAARPIHYDLPRVITAREAARLHSFPDWFRFNSRKWHAFQQIGNSVPPFLARAVAQSIIEALGAKPQKLVAHNDRPSLELLDLSLVQAALHFGIDLETLPKESRAGSKRKR